MRGDLQLVACIPHPVTVPKCYVVASEVATMDFLRSPGLPVPNVYGYSPASDNVAERSASLWSSSTVHLVLPGEAGNRVCRVPTRSTRGEDDDSVFSSWWKPVLCARPGEGGWEAGHCAQGRAVLHRSGCETAAVVWEEVSA